MRSVLVCVQTSSAARAVASCAARLGLTAAVRTAMSETEIMARLAEAPSDVLLVDTALTRPDSAGFTRRVLVRSPGAVIVLFGAEDPKVAEAAVGAGARALIGGTEDPVSTVAKAILLLGLTARPAGPQLPTRRSRSSAGGDSDAGDGPGAHGRNGRHRPVEPAGPAPLPGGPDGPGGSTVGPLPSGDPGGEPSAASAQGAATPRRVVLTGRELQVLRGMANGQSNAEIGRDLFVSEDTIKTHARRLFRKLGARDRAHAVAVGFRAGLVS